MPPWDLGGRASKVTVPPPVPTPGFPQPLVGVLRVHLQGRPGPRLGFRPGLGPGGPPARPLACAGGRGSPRGRGPGGLWRRTVLVVTACRGLRGGRRGPSPGLSLIPSPAVSPVPSPIPAPSPGSSPIPAPSPIPTPGSSPVPSLTPAPVPGRVPGPVPEPVPSPVPGPLPGLVPGRVPGPVPDPVPGPVPDPSPAVSPGLPACGAGPSGSGDTCLRPCGELGRRAWVSPGRRALAAVSCPLPRHGARVRREPLGSRPPHLRPRPAELLPRFLRVRTRTAAYPCWCFPLAGPECAASATRPVGAGRAHGGAPALRPPVGAEALGRDGRRAGAPGHPPAAEPGGGFVHGVRTLSSSATGMR
uniref:tetra-peptide repeat homeobox protein 1-like n=1 Tax=Nyctereutes procyonoides TaxID=34880 RepID=UPI00244400AD|nr:tetra-peptide repeat homeobox protein 1-like [Nyctereutes procyonoides]